MGNVCQQMTAVVDHKGVPLLHTAVVVVIGKENIQIGFSADGVVKCLFLRRPAIGLPRARTHQHQLQLRVQMPPQIDELDRGDGIKSSRTAHQKGADALFVQTVHCGSHPCEHRFHLLVGKIPMSGKTADFTPDMNNAE